MIVLLTWQVWDGVKRPKMFLRTRFANRFSNRSIILRIKLLTTSATAAHTVVGALVIVVIVIVVVVVGFGIKGAEPVRSAAG